MRSLLALLLLSAIASAEGVTVLSHEITLEIDPATSTFKSTDAVRLRGPGTLTIGVPEGVTVVPASVELPAGEHDRTFVFTGKLSAGVEKSGDTTWVAGDRSSGTIGPRGSYLTRGFYVASAGTSLFQTTVKVALPHRAVAPGRRTDERQTKTHSIVTYKTGYAIDSPTVVTGPWVVDQEEIDGVVCRTYLLEQDRGHAPMLLASLREEIPRYQKLFGAVPDGRFDVVSNFFATGYGFPNYTLLGETVIRYVCAKAARSGSKTLPAGYLDHELVHCWLGNYAQVDYEKGNWCEAITTWYANYGSAVRAGTDADYRRKVSRTFSLRVFGERDYPLGKFKSKRKDFENDIGYGKGSMVFHMLERDIGRETLYGAVRHAVGKLGGKAAGWDDFVAALSEGAGRDLRAWFKPWLERSGAPILRWGRVHVRGTRVVGTIRQLQDGPAFPLRVPIVAETAKGREERIVEIASRESAFQLKFDNPPTRLLIDPDHHVFRRVQRADVAPCLEAVSTATKKIGFGDKALLQRMRIPAGEKPELPRDAAVFAIGIPNEIRAALLTGARRQDATLKIRESSFEFRGTTYDKPDEGILLTYTRPRSPGLPVTLFHGNGGAAFARVAYIPYYAAHGWVVFRGGRPIARGNFEGDRGTRLTIGAAQQKPARGILADLLMLTDPKWKGRRAGTPETYELANQLRGRLHMTGAKMLPWPSVQVVTGIMRAPPRLAIGKDTRKGGYYPFYWSAAARDVTCQRVVRHPADEPRGALVLLPEDATYEMMRDYAAKGAAAVAVVASEPTLKARGQQCAWMFWMPESVSARAGNLESTVSGLMARANHAPLMIPAVYLEPDVAKELESSKQSVVLNFIFKRTATETSNIVGVFGKTKAPGLLVSAHWDGVGAIRSAISDGASDNAAGTAIVLWVADQLKRDFEAGRITKPVVIALFGAEEAGLRGSRQLAQLLKTVDCPIGKPFAMLNVDGVGGGEKDSIYVIGRSHYPKLLELVTPHLAKEKLPLGRDIDRFAYARGSDHWPLHEVGVPAVTLYGTNYRAMNTAGDTLARVDVGMLERVARALYRSVRQAAK